MDGSVVYLPDQRTKWSRPLMMWRVPADGQSRHLFGDADYERSRRVMRATDEINARTGTTRCTSGRPDGRGKTKFLRHSLRYTTMLKEVLSIM